MKFYGGYSIPGTGWLKPASGGKKRRDDPTIKMYQGNNDT